jgi:ABC-type Zn uptake system ZnuABC Zn-binding protein ZnuA
MMKTTRALVLLAVLTAGPAHASATGAPPQAAPVRVVTTLPVYGSIVQAIGGSDVDVTWIADPNEDSHFVRPRPSYALELRRADVFVTTGLDLELWVPALLDKAGNGRVLEGGTGYVTAYTGITLLDIPASIDRSQGDVHLYGNPHLHTDPLRALQVARNITTGLKRVAPDRAERWDRGLADFQADIHRRLFGARLVAMLGGETLERLALNGTLNDFLATNRFEDRPLTEHLGGWLATGASLRGARIVCYHKNWAYFEDRFGVRCTEYVETKPGIPPTPRHVARLIDLMTTQDIHVVLAASYFDRGRVEAVANRGHATAVIVPMQTHAGPGLETYPALVDRWIGDVTRALAAHERE